MVEAVQPEIKYEEIITVPEFDIEGKQNIDLYFRLMLAGTPHLKLSVTDKKGKELSARMLNVEMR
ncbi:MAG: hypothetical protein ACFFB0_07565 [Promethearchaeota archaeon]